MIGYKPRKQLHKLRYKNPNENKQRATHRKERRGGEGKEEKKERGQGKRSTSPHRQRGEKERRPHTRGGEGEKRRKKRREKPKERGSGGNGPKKENGRVSGSGVFGFPWEILGVKKRQIFAKAGAFFRRAAVCCPPSLPPTVVKSVGKKTPKRTTHTRGHVARSSPANLYIRPPLPVGRKRIG